MNRQWLVALVGMLGLAGEAQRVDAQSYVVEPDAAISSIAPPEVLSELVRLIRLYGYRCDSISYAHPFKVSAGSGFSGFKVQCHRRQYTYEVLDRGGKFVVCFDKC